MAMTQTKQCPYCAESVQLDAKKCRHCGEWLSCPSCGTENSTGGRFCIVCGAPRGAMVGTGFGQQGVSGQPTTMPARIEASHYAGFWIRVAAWFIDTVIVSVGFIFAAIITLGIGLLLGIFLWWLYFALMESSSKQATLGKMAVGIVVTDLQGNRISFGQATGRYFAQYISAIILGIGFLMCAFTEKKQGLHDIMANTLVCHRA